MSLPEHERLRWERAQRRSSSRGRRVWPRYVAALVLALAAHGVGVALFELTGGAKSSAPSLAQATPSAASSSDDPPIEVQSLVDELQQPDARTAAEKKQEEQKKQQEQQKQAPGQVVEQPAPAIEQRPDQAKYASEYDNKVDHQTKAPNSRESGSSGAATPATPFVPPVAPRPAGQPNAGQASAQAAAKSAGSPAGPSAERADLDGSPDAEQIPTADDGEQRRPGRPTPRRSKAGKLASVGGSANLGPTGAPGPEGETPQPATKPNLTPTREMLERAIGRGGTMDYLHDVDEGSHTAVDSVKWVHAVFFNRVKKAVAQEWHPDVVYVQHDPSGHIYGVKDRVTVLRVHLNPDGSLAGSDVVQSSGVDFLDDEAIAAFKKAQPFPNPPTALIEGDGKIHFSFGFVFELSGRTQFKVYKYE